MFGIPLSPRLSLVPGGAGFVVSVMRIQQVEVDGPGPARVVSPAQRRLPAAVRAGGWSTVLRGVPFHRRLPLIRHSADVRQPRAAARAKAGRHWEYQSSELPVLSGATKGSPEILDASWRAPIWMEFAVFFYDRR